MLRFGCEDLNLQHILAAFIMEVELNFLSFATAYNAFYFSGHRAIKTAKVVKTPRAMKNRDTATVTGTEDQDAPREKRTSKLPL